MADGAVEFLLGKIVSLVENEASLLGGVRDEFNEIKRELESTTSFLKDAERQEATNEGVRRWVQQVRDAAYDVEVIIDEFMYHIGSQHSGSGSRFLHFLHQTVRLPKNIITRHQIATDLQKIRIKIIAISERSKRYGFDRIDGTMTTSHDDAQHHGESSLFIGVDDVVGIDEDKEKLLGWLMDGEQQHTVISVLGMGGSGKTTLVGRVYNSQIVSRHFDCHAWITVSQTYSIENLLKSMLEEFFNSKKELAPNNLSTMNYKRLVETLIKYLQQNRYVVVLDDVWDVNFWNQIIVAFPNSANGSRIMLTTRKEDVACFSFGVGSYVHRIQPLQQNEAWALFCKKAFSAGPNKCCPLELETLARLLVEKCEGLPLVILSVGGLMSSKDRTELEWRKVYDTLHWELNNNPTLDRVKRILLHSFNDLPYHLKYCFLYCCIFPEDYLIERKRLVRLWIAEGFVKERRGMTLEEVAYTYLMELIHRNILQVAIKNSFGRVSRCRMHDIIRELALSISERDKFCGALDDKQQQETREEGRGTRRLSLHKWDKTNQAGLQIHYYNLRSFFVFDNPHFNALPSRCKLLRVLDLQGIPIETVPNELVELFNLRYLNLRDTQVNKLPKSLGKLRQLQVLDITDTKVEALPSSIVKLKNLQYLRMGCGIAGSFEMFDFVRGTKVTPDVCEVKDLQYLGTVEAEGDMIRQVGNLTELRSLGITNVRATDEIELCASIQKMHLLRSLFVMAKNEDESLRMDALCSPPPILQKLHLYGKLEKVPLWISSIKNLVSLCLGWSQLKEDPLSHIHALPNLNRLVLNNAYDGVQLHFRAGFFKLKELWFRNMPQLNHVIIEKGVMPCVYEMDFAYCKELKMVPQGIEHLVNLQELNLTNVSIELVERISGKDRPKVQHIPVIKHVFETSSGWRYESLS